MPKNLVPGAFKTKATDQPLSSKRQLNNNERRASPKTWINPEGLSPKNQLDIQQTKRTHKFSKFKTPSSSLHRDNVTDNNFLDPNAQNIANTDNNQEIAKEKSVYQNINTIRKVARFLQIARSRVIRERNPEHISAQQIFYLENSDKQEEQKQWLFTWDNSLINFLQIFVTIIVIVGIWSYTYEIIFGFAFKDLNIIRTVTLLIAYLVMIVFSLNSQVKTERLEILTKRKAIFILYLKSYFIFDMLLILGVMASFFQVDGLFIISRALTLGALPTILRVMKKTQDKYAVSAEIESLFGILKFVLLILAFLHILSLVLNALSIVQHKNGSINTWVQKNGVQTQTDLQKYIDGYYWAMTILSTVGFGDFTPANSTERGVMTLIMIVCSLFFGYTINVVGNLIGVLRQSKAQFQSQTRRLNNYLLRTGTPNNVKDKIKEYFYNQHKIKQAYDQESENFFLNRMTKQLRNEVMLKNNLNPVQKSKYLKLFTKETQNKIAVALQKVMYAPDETVFNQDTDQIKLYLIEQGEFDQFCYDLPKSKLQDGKKRISKYDKSDNTVGWSNLITGYKYSSCVKSNDYTLVYQLPQQKFLQLIKQNPQDFSKFSQMREKILQKKIQFKKDCFVCDRLTHNVVQCPSIHFIPRPLQTMIIFSRNSLKLLKNMRDVAYIRKNNKKSINIQSMATIISSINSIRSNNQVQHQPPKVNFIIQQILKSVNREKTPDVGTNQVEKVVNSIIRWQQTLARQSKRILRQSKSRQTSKRNSFLKINKGNQQMKDLFKTFKGNQQPKDLFKTYKGNQQPKDLFKTYKGNQQLKDLFKTYRGNQFTNNQQTKDLQMKDQVEKDDIEYEKACQLNQQGVFEYVMLVKQPNFFPSYCIQQILKQMKQDQKLQKKQIQILNRKQTKKRMNNFIRTLNNQFNSTN